MIKEAEIKINRVKQSRISEVDFENIVFGKEFTDHMFICDYENGSWNDARIVPYADLSLSPSLSAIHYGQSIFEGMKAYKSESGDPLLFRPEDNWARLNRSAERMCMPELPKDIFMNGLRSLINIERDWIPTKDGSSLYIRPFMFGTDDFLGVKPSDNYSFIIYCCPVESYYNQSLNVKVEDQFSRAAPGGVGFTKCAGNYGAAMYPTKLAKDMGYDQILWTDATTHEYLEETGTTNFFAFINDKVITPKLNELLLAGITRDSVVQLLKGRGIEVEERPISVKELIDAHKMGALKECFASGTAANIVSISGIGYRGDDYSIEVYEDSLANSIKKEITDIKTGKIEDSRGWVYRV
jgi:branched-chain amino acid aminotransferase